jgi:hypothetical protein
MRYAGLTFDMYDPVCAMHGPPRQIVEARSGTRRLPCRLYKFDRDAEVAELGPAAVRGRRDPVPHGTGRDSRDGDRMTARRRPVPESPAPASAGPRRPPRPGQFHDIRS